MIELQQTSPISLEQRSPTLLDAELVSETKETYTFSGDVEPSGTLVEILEGTTVLTSTIESDGTWSTSFDIPPSDLPSSVTVRASASGFVEKEKTITLDPDVNSYTGINFELVEDIPAGPTLVRVGTGQSLVIDWTPNGDFEGEIEIRQDGTVLKMVPVPAGAEEVDIDPPTSGLLVLRGRYRVPADQPFVSGAVWSPDDPPFAGTTPTVTPVEVESNEYTIQSLKVVFADTEAPLTTEAVSAPWEVTVEEELEADTFFAKWLITAEREGTVEEFTSEMFEVEVQSQEDPDITLTSPSSDTLTQGVEVSLESDITEPFGETLSSVEYDITLDG